jgi:PAS domain S-box-containing protein
MLDLVFPDLEPTYGIVSDAVMFTVAAVTFSAFSAAKGRAESALRESEGRLALALRAARLGVWHCNLKKDEVILSTKYREVYQRDPLTLAEWLTLIHPDDREHVLTAAREGMGGSHQWDAEFRVLLPDGSVRWMHSYATVLVDEAQKPLLMVGVSQDVTESKQAEAVLRESEERFQNMANTAPVMIWVADRDQLCTFFNKRWLEFRGRTLEEELADGWTRGVHPEDLDRCLAVRSSSFDARRNFQIEFRLRRGDGEYRWILDSGTPLNRAGEFAGYIGSSVDITEQKLMAERLQAQTVQLLEAQRLARIGSWERHIDIDKSRWSDELLRILGLTKEAPAGFDTFINHVHPGDRERVVETERRIHSVRAPVEAKFRIIRPDGEIRFIRSTAQAVRNDQDTVFRLVGVIQDITEQVQAQDLLRESEEHLKNAERLARVGHWQWDIRADHISGSEEMY